MRLALILVVLFAATAVAADETKTKKPKESKQQTAVKKDTKKAAQKEAQPKDKKPAKMTAGAGMVVNIDGRGPEGPLDPEIAEALSNMVNTSSEGLREVELDDGTVIVDLQGRFQSAMVVSIDKDGKAKGHCYSTAPDHKCDKTHVKRAPAKTKAKTAEKPKQKN